MLKIFKEVFIAIANLLINLIPYTFLGCAIVNFILSHFETDETLILALSNRGMVCILFGTLILLKVLPLPEFEYIDNDSEFPGEDEQECRQ